MFARLAGYYFLSFAFVGVFAPYFSLYLHDIGTSTIDIAILMADRLLAMAVLALFWNGAVPLLETLAFDHLGTRSARYGTIRRWGSLGFIVAVLAVGRLVEAYSIAVVLWACWLILLSLLLLSVGLPGFHRGVRPTSPCPELRRASRGFRVGRQSLVCGLQSSQGTSSVCLLLRGRHPRGQFGVRLFMAGARQREESA